MEARTLFGHYDKRVRFVSPDGFIAFLEEFEESVGREEAKKRSERVFSPADASERDMGRDFGCVMRLPARIDLHVFGPCSGIDTRSTVTATL